MATIAPRSLLIDFVLANPLYAEAQLYVYVADVATGTATTTLATLYLAPTGTDQEANPFRLDGDGKMRRPVYVDGPVVVRVHAATSVPVHDTGVIGLMQRFREAWEAAAIFQVGDVVRDDEAGANTGYLYICAEAHTAGVWSNDLDAGKWALYLQGGSGGSGGGAEGEFTISLDVGTASANSLRLAGAATGLPVTVEAQSDVDAHVTIRLLPKGNAPIWMQRVHIGDVQPATNPTNTFSRFNLTYPVQALSNTVNGAMRIGGNLFGTLTGGPVGIAFAVTADTDNVNATDGFILNYTGHAVKTGAVGGRTPHFTLLTIDGNVSAGTMKYFTADGAQTIARGSMGGVHNGPLGEVFGANHLAEIHRASGSYPGAGMNVNQLVGYEVNTAAESGTQSLWHHGIQVVQLTNHVTRAQTSDAALIFANQPTTAGYWGAGMQFGAVNGKWAFHGLSSSLISTFPNNNTIVSEPYEAADGVDFSKVTFGRASWLTAGAALDGDDNFGAQTTAGVTVQTRDGIVAKTAVVNTVDVLDPGLGSLGQTQTLEFDAPPGGGTTALATVASWVCGRVGRIDSAGSNFQIGDILTDTGGTASRPAAFKVIRVSAATNGVTDLMPLAAYVTGSISGTTLTVSSASYGSLAVGMRLDGTNVLNGTYIVSGSHPTWTVSKDQTVASTVIAATTFLNTSGSYTVRSGDATVLSGGSGTGCTVTLLWGIEAVTVTNAGTPYAEFPAPGCRALNSGLRPAKLRVTMTATQTDLRLNPGGKVIVGTHTPSSASASGAAGMIAWDSSYIYIATASNTWKRAAIATW